ncbi:hypothetical protein HYPSUDRAFT_58201 [Hypholoma sublateritium FD-334 SS-4]|uniref:Uncharacterized protein n=1 Tax=Hypholoma sublateritium (strain FD-334 SS-4) TaxID=945553 RepID=A0A0D2KPG3_HYPSF|nr:hypothetical protein HYPSUDRAFT_58201 [Hypholoma sublateritium FD-334 SS-4]
MPQVPARPPPRSSVPTESVFDDDAASAFSFSIYEVDLGDARSGGSSSSASAYSQPSFDAFAAHDVAFDLDGGMMLPVSLPATPNDIDDLTGWDDEVEFVFDEEEEIHSMDLEIYIVRTTINLMNSAGIYIVRTTRDDYYETYSSYIYRTQVQ